MVTWWRRSLGLENSPAIYGLGFTVRNHHQSRQGRKKWPAVPGGNWKKGLPVFPAINGRAILADNKAGNRRGATLPRDAGFEIRGSCFLGRFPWGLIIRLFAEHRTCAGLILC
jgi:hypothetical protein